MALSTAVGLRVLGELMAEEATEIAGPKGRHDPERIAKRHGKERGSVTLGGRRLRLWRPRLRSADDRIEIRLATYEHFARRDPLAKVVFGRGSWPGSAAGATSARRSRSAPKRRPSRPQPRARRSPGPSSSAPAPRSAS